MAYKVFLDRRAEKELNKIPKDYLKIVLAAISELENFSPKAKNIKKLHTPFMGYRKRIGDYRVLFKVTKKELFVYSVKHRKDAYR